MVNFGNFYTGSLRYWHRKFLPIIERGSTQETELPFRFGNSLVFRVPFTYKGIFIGQWVFNPQVDPDDDEQIDQILLEALSINSLIKKDRKGN